MIIKKFLGKTEEAAVEAARKELGEGIVIMNVKTVKRKGIFALFGSKQVEVTVAVESEEDSSQKTVKAGGQEQKVQMAGGNDGSRLDPESIERRLESLQMLLESQIGRESRDEGRNQAEFRNFIQEEEKAEEQDRDAEQEETPADPEQDKLIRLLYNTMIDNEVDEKYANLIMEEADKTRKPNIPFDYILANIYQKMVLKFGKSDGIVEAERDPKVVFFIGPTGVGKTTTIAKIASSFSMDEKKRVAMITTDTYRIAAAEQLRTYANILEAPFRVIYTEEELVEAIRDFRDYDYVFVDTAGHSHQNTEHMEKLKSFLKAAEENAEYQTFLVLSSTTKYKDLREIAETYKKAADYQLIFTKLDETVAYGSLFNLKMHVDTPIAYVTYGQNVPDDIERFNPQKTVKKLLGGNY